MPRGSLYPFLQGTLDGLCGLYSIVNALRFALRTLEFNAPPRSRSARTLKQDDAELLFLFLLTWLIKSKQQTRRLIDGVNTSQLAALLRYADEWLRDQRDIRLSAVRPFAGSGRVSTKTLLTSIDKHLAFPGSAAIIGGKAPWDHWTVATRVTPGRLYLLDSGGDTSVAAKRGKRAIQYHAGLVEPECLFLLKLRDRRKPASTS